MSKHIQPISQYPPHERIRKNISDKKKKLKKKRTIKIRYWNDSHLNLNRGSAGFTYLEAILKNDAFAAQVTIGQCRPWSLYLELRLTDYFTTEDEKVEAF